MSDLVYWPDAVKLCEKEGAYLASIMDEAENRFAAGENFLEVLTHYYRTLL